MRLMRLRPKPNLNYPHGSCSFLPNGARVYNNLVEVCDAPHAPWLTCTL